MLLILLLNSVAEKTGKGQLRYAYFELMKPLDNPRKNCLQIGWEDLIATSLPKVHPLKIFLSLLLHIGPRGHYPVY